MDDELLEPMGIQTDYIDGLANIAHSPTGNCLLSFFAFEIDSEGKVQRILVTKLRMSKEVMRDVAVAMLGADATEIGRYDSQRAERRKKMT